MPWFVFLGCAIAMPPSAIRKRPVSAMFESGPAAAPAAYERDAPWHAGLDPEKPQWTPRPHSQPFPEIKWGNHLVRTLVSNGHLPSQSTKSVNINVWSDCSGINSEMFALQALSDSIREIIGANVQCNLYYTCDSDTKSIVFAIQNHAPKHVGIDMNQRKLQRKRGVVHSVPEESAPTQEWH